MTTQLRAIYTEPSKISPKQPLLRQIKEFSEIGFNKKFETFIKSNENNLLLYMDLNSEDSEYTENHWNFLNDLIRALSLAKKDINTVIIRQKRDDILFLSRQGGAKNRFKKIDPIDDSELGRNVIKRVDAFQQVLISQKLLLEAKSLVSWAKKDIVDKQNLYVQLITDSNYSLNSIAEFDENLQLWFDKLSSVPAQLEEKKRSMDEIIKKHGVSPTIEKIQKELSEQEINFESIKKQAEELMRLTTLLKKIQTIEALVIEKAEELLIPSDADKLQELLKFISEKEEEIVLLKQEVNGTSKTHTQTLLVIEKIEQSIGDKKKQAESLQQDLVRNQQLVLKAKSIVKSAHENLDANQRQFDLIRKIYSNLLEVPDYSQEKFNEFDRNFDSWFDDKSISTLNMIFNEKWALKEILEGCETSDVKEIKKELNELKGLQDNVESIKEQAQDLKSLRRLLEKIKIIAQDVNKKEGELITDNADNLQAFIQFIAEKKEKLHEIKKAIDGKSKMHQQTVHAIERLEETFMQKQVEAEFRLQQIKMKNIESQPKIEDYSGNDSGDNKEKKKAQDEPSKPEGEAQQNRGTNPPDQGSNREEEKKSEEDKLAEDKKERLTSKLREAISLIQIYKNTLSEEQQKCSFLFFYKLRNQAKLDYCQKLEDKLKSEIRNIDGKRTVHDIINKAHDSVLTHMNDKAKVEVTKGGSYLGTSRMLSLQRLLGIDEAWKKGHSKIFGDDYHGLKKSGVVGEKAQEIVNEFYRAANNKNDKEFQDLKNKTFPSEVTSKKQSSP